MKHPCTHTHTYTHTQTHTCMHLQGDPMRLLFSKSASPHHGFAAYYTYLEKIFKADAVLHFGTHGSLEFMPGKQVSSASACEGMFTRGGERRAKVGGTYS